MNNIAHLVRMANQIGTFLSAMPDREQAVADIANHLQKFWEPRMRRAILSFVEEHPDGRSDEAALDPIVHEAITRYADRLRPAPATHPGSVPLERPGV